MVGLLTRKRLDPDEGLWLVPCVMIHTVGMRFPIDAVFLDRSLRVVGVTEHLAPHRLGRPFAGTFSVLEIAAGRARELEIEVGDRLDLRERSRQVLGRL